MHNFQLVPGTFSATMTASKHKRASIFMVIDTYFVFGNSSSGRYLCIPGWELASYHDIFWNMERLERQIGKVDAITVATAIKEAATIIEKQQ